jgi:hypothetical protein
MIESLSHAAGASRFFSARSATVNSKFVEPQHGTTDYWVNAMDGRPFFVVSCAVDPGLLSVLREQIVPRLKSRCAKPAH